MNIKLVVFDMAGTTVDEGNVVYHTLHKAITLHSIQVSFEEVLIWGAGKEKLQAIRDILLNCHPHIVPESEIDAIFKTFLLEFDLAYENLLVIPIKNTERLFKELKELGIKVALNTGYNRQTATSLLKKLNWNVGVEYDLLVTASDVSKNRPAPDMILFAMNTLQILEGENVIKVGDSVIDIEEGKNANCKFSIGITTGAHTKDQLAAAKPSYIIDNIYDIKNIILNA